MYLDTFHTGFCFLKERKKVYFNLRNYQKYYNSQSHKICDKINIFFSKMKGMVIVEGKNLIL